MVYILNHIISITRKRKTHKFEVGNRILFLDYRAENQLGNGLGVRKRLGCITRRSIVNKLPTYHVILLNSNNGVLRHVPERNIELYAEMEDT